jgi:hypothetical protein
MSQRPAPVAGSDIDSLLEISFEPVQTASQISMEGTFIAAVPQPNPSVMIDVQRCAGDDDQ